MRRAVLYLFIVLIAAGAFWAPPARADAPAQPADSQAYLLAEFRTPIVSAEPGRVQNLALAAAKINGVVLQPGQIFSFNGVVGPRDAAHGWAQANEIYQGEYVLGYGGGICQVTSTLYNAALLGGLEIMERYHHDRPLQYINPGRDATVVWNKLDFRFRNSLDAPVRVGARILPGEPQYVEITLHVPVPRETEKIDIEEEQVKFLAPQLVEVPDSRLAAGERVVVDEGHAGLEVKIYRVFGEGSARRRELVSHDVYPPKHGRVRLGTRAQAE